MRWVLMLFVILAALLGGEAPAVVVSGRVVVRERGGRAEAGDALAAWRGEPVAVLANLPEAETATWNLEVENEHVYRVGPAGILVHNPCTTPKELFEGGGGAEGGWRLCRQGQAGEAVPRQLTGMPNNTVRIPSASGKKAYGVPDQMDDAQRHLTETNNVDYQYYSSQLKDDKAHVLRGRGPGRVDVMIDQRTTISTQLLREHLNPGSPIKLRSANLNK